MKPFAICLAFLLSRGLFNFSSFTSSFINPPAFFARTTAESKSFKFISKSRIASSTDGSHYQPVEKLNQLCNTCTIKNTNGLGLKSIDEELLQVISKSLNETCLLSASTFGAFLLSSPFPAKSVIFEGDDYILCLLTVPCGMEVSMQNHDFSSLLLYKPLRGSGELKTITDAGVTTDQMNGNNDFNILNTAVLQKSGGHSRIFSSRDTGSGPSVFLELAFKNLELSGLIFEINNLLFFSS